MKMWPVRPWFDPLLIFDLLSVCCAFELVTREVSGDGVAFVEMTTVRTKQLEQFLENAVQDSHAQEEGTAKPTRRVVARATSPPQCWTGGTDGARENPNRRPTPGTMMFRRNVGTGER